MAAQYAAGTKPSMIIAMSAIAVALILFPGGSIVGFALAGFAAIVVRLNPQLRSRPELVVVSVLALFVTGVATGLIWF